MIRRVRRSSLFSYALLGLIGAGSIAVGPAQAVARDTIGDMAQGELRKPSSEWPSFDQTAADDVETPSDSDADSADLEEEPDVEPDALEAYQSAARVWILRALELLQPPAAAVEALAEVQQTRFTELRQLIAEAEKCSVPSEAALGHGLILAALNETYIGIDLLGLHGGAEQEVEQMRQDIRATAVQAFVQIERARGVEVTHEVVGRIARLFEGSASDSPIPATAGEQGAL